MARWISFLRFLDEARQMPDDASRQVLVDELLQERPEWPWVEGRLATFIYVRDDVDRVALNLDIIEADPPFAPLVNLPGTSLWYIQREFQPDDVLDYLFAVNDPMTPIRQERDLAGRVKRYWQADYRNPLRISTAQTETSVLRMAQGRPFPDWTHMPSVPRGRIQEHEFSSLQMGFEGRKLWVYTPPGYDSRPDHLYPLLVLLDGQWMVGPMQVPYIADALIKHGRMEPVIIAMKQSAGSGARIADYVSNDRHYTAILTELLPLLQTAYRIDSTNLGLGGVGVGAIAAAHAALKNPAVFSHLIMLSPPLGKGQGQEQLAEYSDRFRTAALLPRRIFQSVGRYEMPSRFYRPGLELANVLSQREQRGDVDYEFAELGSGHGLVAFRSVFPEALAHIFPGSASLS